LAAIGERIVDAKEVHMRDSILSGKAGSLPSAERTVGQQQPESSDRVTEPVAVQGMSRYPGDCRKVFSSRISEYKLKEEEH
jgi:hypothetical protein